LPRVKDRSADRARLARHLVEEARQVEAARRRLATGQPAKLSQLDTLDRHAFGLFLGLLGEALTEQAGPDVPVDRLTGDGTLHIRLAPLAADSRAEITTPDGIFAGRDHVITITSTEGTPTGGAG